MVTIIHPTGKMYMLLSEVKAYNEQHDLGISIQGSSLVQIDNDVYIPASIIEKQLILQIWKEMQCVVTSHFF